VGLTPSRGVLTVVQALRCSIDLLPKEVQIYQWVVALNSSERNELEKHDEPDVIKSKRRV
jgi:hypothetical protein